MQLNLSATATLGQKKMAVVERWPLQRCLNKSQWRDRNAWKDTKPTLKHKNKSAMVSTTPRNTSEVRRAQE